MKRLLTTEDSHDIQFNPGSSFPVAFAVCDGSNVERNGMKDISTWLTAQMPNEQCLKIVSVRLSRIDSLA